MPRGKNKAKAKTPVTITYKSICDTIIRGVSSSKHYLHFLPDKRNIDNAIKLGALYMRDDYSNTSDLEKLGIAEGILLPQDFNRDDFLDVLLNHPITHSWKIMAYSEDYKDERHTFLNPYQLSFTKNLFGLDSDVDEDPLRMIYRKEIQDSVLRQYDDARTAFFQMCVHEGAQLGALKLNRLQIDLQRRGRLLSMADIDRHAGRVHTEDGNLHRTTSPHDSKPPTVSIVIAVASDPSVSIASEYIDEAATTDSEESVVVDDTSSSSSDEEFRGLFDAHRDPEIDEYNDEDATADEPATTDSEEPVVVNATNRYFDKGSPWAQYDMDETDYYYASICGLHATPRGTLEVNTFRGRSEFHSLSNPHKVHDYNTDNYNLPDYQ